MMVSPKISRHGWTILALEWLAAVNFRTALIGVAPVLPLILTNTHLSHAAGGLLFSTPVLMMGLCAIPGGLLADRLGPHRMIIGCLLALALFGALRATPSGAIGLFLFTCCFGIATGLAQPALPKLVKLHHPERSGTATAIYSSGFMVGALAAAGITTPLLLPALGGWSWRGTFVVWAVIAGLCGSLWILSAPRGHVQPTNLPPFRDTLRNPLLWLVTAVFVSVDTVFFTISSWLPSYYHSLGWSLSASSAPLTAFNIAALVACVLAPIVSDRLDARRPVFIVLAVILVAGTAGLLVAPLSAPILWATMIGAGNDGLFVLCLALPVELAPRDRVGSFTGLMLSFGYSAAVGGPFLAGAFRDASGTFASSMVFTLGIAMMALLGAFLLPESHPRSSVPRASLLEGAAQHLTALARR